METARIIELTNTEKKKLNAEILGYGKLKEVATKTGLHQNTIKLVSFKGTGTPETIQILREKILGTAEVSDKVESISE